MFSFFKSKKKSQPVEFDKNQLESGNYINNNTKKIILKKYH